MLTDATGKPIATDGPTGREIHLVEIIKNNQSTWGLAPVGGGFDKLEVIQILSIAAHGVATQARGEMFNAKAMADVKAKMDKLKQGEK